MVDVDLLLGRPLSEAVERLERDGTTFSVRTTGLVGRAAMDRRSQRDDLVAVESRVLQVRERDRSLELVVAPAFRRIGEVR